MSAKKSEEQILKALAEYRKSGNINNFPDIINILRENHDGEIAKAATLLISDIKNDKMIPLLVDALRDKENNFIRKHLVQACWESGLNFTDHMVFFVDLFLVLDYMGALEAFSLIENTIMDHDVNDSIKQELVAKIRTVILDLPEHNKDLALELIHLLEGK